MSPRAWPARAIQGRLGINPNPTSKRKLRRPMTNGMVGLDRVLLRALTAAQKLQGPVVEGHNPVGIVQVAHAVEPDFGGLGRKTI